MIRRLDELSWPEVAALDTERAVLLLPIGATEQHGPHLPLATDTLLVDTLLVRALERLPEDVHAWLAPTLPYGRSREHEGFPGTLSLRGATLAALLRDLARGVAEAGFRRLAFVNGHGGNVAVLDAAARDIRADTGLMVFCLHPALLVAPPFEVGERETRLGLHAGELETSLLLTLAPELVAMERAPAALPDVPDGRLGLTGAASFAWLTRDWSPTGAFGDATEATAAKGDAIAEAAAERLAALIAEIARFEIPNAGRAGDGNADGPS